GEQLTLRHSATDRGVFARGALRAGAWLARRQPGAYAMADVLREK
ncbi:MAG: 4-hydroxy-tetrahydrodipicolinate reductase, partial [Proteobacteria bacterium]|nr:4-hydroxy-tetrahydrodipicolinate reductase [Pseudomonadota bacterium]